jgi:hypothetical protein
MRTIHYSARLTAQLLIGLLILSIITGCGLFQRDPTGASLIVMKNAYEGIMREAGSAYQQQVITRAQLQEFIDVGGKFYSAYIVAEAAYELKNLPDAQQKAAALPALLTEIQKLALKYLTSTQKKGVNL